MHSLFIYMYVCIYIYIYIYSKRILKKIEMNPMCKEQIIHTYINFQIQNRNNVYKIVSYLLSVFLIFLYIKVSIRKELSILNTFPLYNQIRGRMIILIIITLNQLNNCLLPFNLALLLNYLVLLVGVCFFFFLFWLHLFICF